MAVKAKPGDNVGTIAIRKPNREHVFVEIRGESPLIVHAWSSDAIAEMLAKQMGTAVSGPRPKKDPEKAFAESLYFMPGSSIMDPKPRFAFKAIAFKCAMVRVCKGMPGLTMTDARLMFFVMGHKDHEWVEIEGTPRNRQDMVRLSGIDRKPDIRFRGEFPQWTAILRIGYNADATNLESMVNLVAQAGCTIGVGERRADTEGNNFGQWEVTGYGVPKNA